MLHVIIDTSIYRRDPKRATAAFRAFTLLARGSKLQLHNPYYVKQEFLTQQHQAIGQALTTIGKQAMNILRISGHEELEAYAEETKRHAEDLIEDAANWATEEFNDWLAKSHAIDQPVKPEYAQRVTDDYFSGAPPFSSRKQRKDLPDSFIWHTALDLVQEHGTLHIIVHDEGLHKATSDHENMVAYKTLEEFIQTLTCQQALEGLTNKIIAANIERSKALLLTQHEVLTHSVEYGLVGALNGKSVSHPSIPDDNNEATILTVDKPDDLTFDFEDVEYYGDGELGIPFTARVECGLHYAIYKGDYYTMPDEDAEDITIEELNDHYFGAKQNYTIEVKGDVSVPLDLRDLEDQNVSDDDLSDFIHDADHSVEIFETDVFVPSNEWA